MQIGYEIPKIPEICPIPKCNADVEIVDCKNGAITIRCNTSKHNTVHENIFPSLPVIIEPNQIFIAGTTGTGKSELMRRLIAEAEELGMTLLIIDVKKKRDYADFNADIRPYIKQQMEPIVIKDSIETTERYTIKQQFGALIDTVAESETWQEMLAFTEQEMKTASKWDRKDFKILRYFLKRLIDDYNKFDWSDTLELKKGINVIDVSQMQTQMQQLVVGSIINHVYDNLEGVTIIMDEAHKFVPQGKTTGCSRDVVDYAREGRASENWLWLADQTMAGVEKNVLKQMQYWILGRQTEVNEVEKTVKQIPRAKRLGINADYIQTLGVGEFLVASHEGVTKTYIQPLWVDDATAINIAIGETSAKKIAKDHKKSSKEDDEMAYRGKFEAEQSKNRELKATITDLKKMKDPVTVEMTVTKEVPNKEYEKKIADLTAELSTSNEAYLTSEKVMKMAAADALSARKSEEHSIKVARKLEDEISEIKSIGAASIEFQESGRKFFGLPLSDSGASSVTTTTVEEICRRMIAEIPPGNGRVITNITEALRNKQQQKIFKIMKNKLDTLNKGELDILGYLLSSNGHHRLSMTCAKLYGIGTGDTYKKFKKSLDILVGLGIAKISKSEGMTATVSNFVSLYLEDVTDTDGMKSYEEDIIQYILQKEGVL